MAELKINLIPLDEVDQSEYVKYIFELSLQQLASPGNMIATFININDEMVYAEVRVRLEAPKKAPEFPPLGSVYVSTPSYSEPVARRVVGYTKTMVITEPVPVVSNYHPGGGTHTIDNTWLLNNPVSDVVVSKHAKNKLTYDKDGDYLKKGKDTFRPAQFNKIYTSSEY